MLLFALIPFIFVIIRTYIQLFVCVVLDLGGGGRRGVEGGGKGEGRKEVGRGKGRRSGGVFGVLSGVV